MLTTLLITICILIINLMIYTRLQRKRLEVQVQNLRDNIAELLEKHAAAKTLSANTDASITASALHTLVATFIDVMKQANICLFKTTLPERIGHLALETDVWLKESILNGISPKFTGFIISKESVANEHLLSYLEEKFSFLVSASQWKSLTEYFPEINELVNLRHDYGVAYLETASLYQIYSRWSNRSSLFALREQDKIYLHETLQEWGVEKEDWFVCFHNREPGYAAHDDNHHAYRNAEIESLIPAMQAIVARGGWVVRMGDQNVKPLPKIDRVIDYAHSKQRSARMDILLCAAAKFFVGNTSGLFIVSTMFGVPVVSVNFAPMSALQYTHRDISIPKLLFSKRKNRLLSFDEVLNSPLANLRYSSHFDSEGVQVVDNTSDEITDAVLEMFERVSGICEYNENDDKLQMAFLSLVKPGHYGYGSAARVGRDFLRKHKELLPAIK